MDKDLRIVGGAAAVLSVLSFVTGVVLLASSGVETIIPDTGAAALRWADQVDDGGQLFLAGGWLVVVGGLLTAVALVAVYELALSAARWLVMAPVLAAVAMTLVTISHLIPVALAGHLTSDFASADGGAKQSLASTLKTFADLSQALNLTGDELLWGVVVPLYAFAILKTRFVPRWIGWLGFVTALFGGWLGLVGVVFPALDVSGIGFLAFFVWMAALGVSLLRGRELPEKSTSVPH